MCDRLGVLLSHGPQPLQLLGRDTRAADVHRPLERLRLDLMKGKRQLQRDRGVAEEGGGGERHIVMV